MADPNPPFVVRDKDNILRQLGDFTLPYGFTAMPVMNSNGKVSFFTNYCPFVYMHIEEAFRDPDTFSEYDEFIDEIR